MVSRIQIFHFSFDSPRRGNEESTLVCSSWCTYRCLVTGEVSWKTRFLVYKNCCIFVKSQRNSKIRYALKRLNLGLSIGVGQKRGSHIDFCKKMLFYPDISCFFHSTPRQKQSKCAMNDPNCFYENIDIFSDAFFFLLFLSDCFGSKWHWLNIKLMYIPSASAFRL